MRRYSFGGQLVANSLASSGMQSVPRHASLIETTMQRRLSVVLVQNSWNVIPWHEFRERARPYRLRWKVRALARRLVARVNLRRARKILCLTESLRPQIETLAPGKVEVLPIAMPWGFSREAPQGVYVQAGTALVVGTITWYKRPELALEVIASHAPNINLVTFVGGIEAQEFWEQIMRRAEELGLQAQHRLVPAIEMPRLYAQAEVTVLPSSLESLGFAVIESLLYGNRVLVSDIPAHRDASRNLGGSQPEWFDADAQLVTVNEVQRERATESEVRSQWTALRDHFFYG